MQRAQAKAEQQQAMREQKTAMMAQLLSGEAAERLGAIRAVKPEKAEKLESIIL